MRRRIRLGSLVIAAHFGFQCLVLAAPAQMQVAREIRVPVPASLGAFGWEDPSKEHVAIAVAPDKSLLVLDPDSDGNWLLARVKGWWTEAPVVDVLRIPGWTKDGKYCCELNVELQVTPNGRYAVAFENAVWGGPLFQHRKFVPRRPDTIVTVVDLEHWTIARSVHVLDWADMDLRGARVLNDGWIALQGLLLEDAEHPYVHIQERRNRLLSIPQLQAGPDCVSRWVSKNLPGVETARATWVSIIQSQDRKNDEVCTALLKTAQLRTVKEWESLVYKGHASEPANLRLHSLHGESELEHEVAQERFPMTSLEAERSLYFDKWNRPDYEMYAVGESFESGSGNWYAVDVWGDKDSVHSTLRIFNPGGGVLKEGSVPGALCDGEKSHGFNAAACGCHIKGAAEGQHTLMAFCSVQRGDFEGMLLKQWIAVVRTDDYSNVGSIMLPKNETGQEALVTVNDRVYVLVVSAGQVVRVYDVTRQH